MIEKLTAVIDGKEVVLFPVAPVVEPVETEVDVISADGTVEKFVPKTE